MEILSELIELFFLPLTESKFRVPEKSENYVKEKKR